MFQRILDKWHGRPNPVFGEKVSNNTFNVFDIQEIYHVYDGEDELCGVFKLHDGRFVALHDKGFEGSIPKGSLYASNTYEGIVKLGLTTGLRRELGIEV